jgi:hypothetical protein
MVLTNCEPRILGIAGKLVLPGKSIDLPDDAIQRPGVRLVIEAGRVKISPADLDRVIACLKAKGPSAPIAGLLALREGRPKTSKIPNPPKVKE